VADDATQTLKDIKQAWHEETVLQFFNPFRHIRRLIMLCHAYSIGISTDNLPYVPPLITAGFGMIVELLTDWHYGAESGGGSSHKETPDTNNSHSHGYSHSHNHGHGHGDSSDPSLSSLAIKIPSDSHEESKTDDSHEHDHNNREKDPLSPNLEAETHNHSHDDEENDHDHGSFLDKPVRFFNYIAAGWDYLAAKLSGKWNYSWEEARNKFIPSPDLPKAPRISESLKMYLIDSELTIMEKEYEEKGVTTNDKAIAREKKDAFGQLRTSLSTMTTTPSAEVKGEKTERASTILNQALNVYPVLSQHRYSYFQSPPDSKVAIQDIISDEILGMRPSQA